MLCCDRVKIVEFYGIKAEVSQPEPPGHFWTFTDFVLHPQRKIGFYIFKWLDKSEEEYYFVTIKRLTARVIWYNEIKTTELENSCLKKPGLNQMLV